MQKGNKLKRLTYDSEITGLYIITLSQTAAAAAATPCLK